MTTQTTPKLTRGTIEVTDPPTNSVWGSVPVGQEYDVNAAVKAAHTAFTTGPWSKTTPTECVLRSCYASLTKSKPGKPNCC